jgi:hypothetical protein
MARMQNNFASLEVTTVAAVAFFAVESSLG